MLKKKNQTKNKTYICFNVYTWFHSARMHKRTQTRKNKHDVAEQVWSNVLLCGTESKEKN